MDTIDKALNNILGGKKILSTGKIFGAKGQKDRLQDSSTIGRFPFSPSLQYSTGKNLLSPPHRIKDKTKDRRITKKRR